MIKLFFKLECHSQGNTTLKCNNHNAPVRVVDRWVTSQQGGNLLTGSVQIPLVVILNHCAYIIHILNLKACDASRSPY